MPGFVTCAGNLGKSAQPLPMHSRGSRDLHRDNSGQASILLTEKRALVKGPGRNLGRRMPVSLGNMQRGILRPGTSTAILPGTQALHGTCINLWHHR